MLSLNPSKINVTHHISIDLHGKAIDWFLYDGEHWSIMG